MNGGGRRRLLAEWTVGAVSAVCSGGTMLATLACGMDLAYATGAAMFAGIAVAALPTWMHGKREKRKGPTTYTLIQVGDGRGEWLSVPDGKRR